MRALWKRYVYSVGPQTQTGRGKCGLLAFCQEAVREGGVGRDWRDGGLSAVVDGLDVAAMRRAAVPLVGEHDFAAFQSKNGRATTVRTLHRFGPASAEASEQPQGFPQ